MSAAWCLSAVADPCILSPSNSISHDDTHHGCTFSPSPLTCKFVTRIEDELHRSLIVGALKEIVGDTVEGREADSGGEVPASGGEGGEANNGDAAAAG